MMRTTDPQTSAPAMWPSSLAFLRTGRHGTVTEIGGPVNDLLKHHADHIIGSPFGTWGATRWPLRVVTDMATALAAGEVFAAYLPLDGRDGEKWTFALMFPLAGGVLAIHAEPATQVALDEAQAWYRSVAEAEAAARADGADDDAIGAAGGRAAESYWSQSIWATHEEFLAAAVIDQATAVAGVALAQAVTPVTGDPMEDMRAVIGGMEANLGSRLRETEGIPQLVERLRETSWGTVEMMGTLGRISSAAVIGSSEAGASAPVLLATAKAVAAFGARATGGLDTVGGHVRTTRSLVAHLGIHMGAVTLLAHVVAAAAATAWPPKDPGPGTVPAASVAEMARLLVGMLDDLIGELGATRDALARTADLAVAAASDVAAFHQMAGSWRLQLPRWDVADRLGPYLSAMDGRARLGGEQVGHLQGLADGCRHGIERCVTTGLFEAMNEIDALAVAARGPRGRHAGDTP
ncbi:MAG: hypothetical protein LBK59_06685 [Bifidobacteriaceae bacterium]|jgi:hypothetical protein|nr:hypothetical protein [Bifidobacteriaceae bacterium]